MGPKAQFQCSVCVSGESAPLELAGQSECNSAVLSRTSEQTFSECESAVLENNKNIAITNNVKAHSTSESASKHFKQTRKF